MEVYEIELNGKQYAMLEKMLLSCRASQLAGNEPIKGYDLFEDMLEDIYAPVADGWSPLDICLMASVDKLELLRYLTKHIMPDDEGFFVRQIGRRFRCRKDFEIMIVLNFPSASV